VEEAAGEGLALASLAVGPCLKNVLHEEGLTTDRTLGLDDDVER
jgi:hypothetical protein